MGDFIGAAGSLIEAESAYKASKYNAALARQNATWARQQAAQDAHQVNVQGRKQVGEMRASFGANGVTLEGSAFDVLQESALAVKRDELNVKVAGERRALSLEQGAQLDEYQGRAARLVGYTKAAAGVGSGAAKIATGA